MRLVPLLLVASAVLPAVLMGAAMLASAWRAVYRPEGPAAADGHAPWRVCHRLSWLATLSAAISLGLQLASSSPTPPLPWMTLTLSGAWVALLVQGLGTVIGVFSARYLDGERGQARYAAALSGVLAAVQLLLLADHWLLLIGSWAAAGIALQHLLTFYADRPFAQLAAHKKRMADRLADLFLLTAAALSVWEVGSGSLSALRDHLATAPASPVLQASAICLALAVLLRTALLPMHGWLIQVMEAPTPVSALLHAGVVNLGGWVLIRFAPLLEAAPAARWLLVGAGLVTALLAGLVMLTRISIKVRLAWSTVAQMGFMVMECGLGLYTLALLHLLGHSLYKAHAFLMASSVVEETRRAELRGGSSPTLLSMMAAPAWSVALIGGMTGAVHALWGGHAWPMWWTAVLGLAWAPLLWTSASAVASAATPDRPDAIRRWISGLAMVAALCGAALVGHALPFGVIDAPDTVAGWVAAGGMALLYGCLVLMQSRADALAGWRRRSYAGFYIDEYVTRMTLRLWPTRWTTPAPH